MNNNYLKFLKLILKKNTLLRVLQIYECFNIGLYGTSIEFGATDNKDKTFSNFVKGKSKFHYSNKISNQKLRVFYSYLTKKLNISSNKYNNVLLFNILEHLPEYKLAFSEIFRIIKKEVSSLDQFRLFIRYMQHQTIILDLLSNFLNSILKNINLNE